MTRVQYGQSVLVGHYGVVFETDPWHTAGWWGPPASGFDGHIEFFLDGGLIIDLPYSEKGPVGWFELEEEA